MVLNILLPLYGAEITFILHTFADAAKRNNFLIINVQFLLCMIADFHSNPLHIFLLFSHSFSYYVFSFASSLFPITILADFFYFYFFPDGCLFISVPSYWQINLFVSCAFRSFNKQKTSPQKSMTKPKNTSLILVRNCKR